MVLFIDAQDRQWFSGRVNSEHSRAIAYAVTASIRLLYDSGVDRRLTSANLRRSLAMYRGCRFITGDEDSAGGMVSILDLRGEKKFIGGFNGGHAHSLVEALNLTLELLAAPSSREVTSGDETSRPALPSASSRRT